MHSYQVKLYAGWIYSINSWFSRHVYEFYAQGGNYDELHAANKTSSHLWSSYVPDTSFKFVVTAYNHKISESRQRNIVESFSYMGFLGKIDMKNPQVLMGCFEECLPTLALGCLSDLIRC
jgi:hypothetical protein